MGLLRSTNGIWVFAIRTPFGRVTIKPNRYSLFTERYGHVPSFAFLGLRFTLRSNA